MRAEPSEHGQFLAAHQHVYRVDLDHTHPVEQLAAMALVDNAGRASNPEALSPQRDATSRRRRNLLHDSSR